MSYNACCGYRGILYCLSDFDNLLNGFQTHLSIISPIYLARYSNARRFTSPMCTDQSIPLDAMDSIFGCVVRSLCFFKWSQTTMCDNRLRTSQSFFLVYYHVLPWLSRVGEYCWKWSSPTAGNGVPLSSPQLQTYCSSIRPVWVYSMRSGYLNGQRQSWVVSEPQFDPLVEHANGQPRLVDLHAEIEDIILIGGIGYRICAL